MKTNRTLIAMCIATIFASGSLCAKDKWEYHTDGWEKTKSYGNVMVANDTASQWGPWEEFVEPAAGAPSIGFLGAGAGDPYRIIPNPIPPNPNPEAGCAVGEWCGYMANRLSDKNNLSMSRMNGNDSNGFFPGEIALIFEQPDEAWHRWGGVKLVVTSGPEIPGVGTETPMIPTYFNTGKQGSFSGWISDKYWDNYVKIASGFNFFNPFAYNFFYYFYNDYTGTYVSDYAAMGLLKAKVTKYIDSCNDGCIEEEETTAYVPFVAGKPTPLAEMHSLRAGNISAEYRGKTALANGHVYMNVNFGNATWTGSWNGSGYGHNAADFDAKGTISGTTFASNKVYTYAQGQSVSGSVKGTFYGPQAAAAGGVVDVTKIYGYGKEGSSRYVDVFLANKTYQQVGPIPVKVVD